MQFSIMRRTPFCLGVGSYSSAGETAYSKPHEQGKQFYKFEIQTE